ncbi:MAG: RNA polymerase sigma factor [Armatimonadota bacterium]
MSHQEQIYRFFLQHGCIAQDAEDLTQWVCLRLCEAGFTEEEMSFDQIAEELGCSPRAVRSLYQRAIKKLRKHFNVQDKRGGTS